MKIKKLDKSDYVFGGFVCVLVITLVVSGYFALGFGGLLVTVILVAVEV